MPAVDCRVVTWNLWWRFGDWQRRFEAIAAVLRDVVPDVVGLQEVWARGDVNAAALLARRRGMHWAWVPSPYPQRWQRKIDDSSIAFGNAVLSRWPVAGVAHADLPAPRSGAPDAAPFDRGVTWSRSNPHVKATGEPDARIDYVLVGMPRRSGAVLIQSARVVGDRPRDGVWASDHAAVAVDLRLGEAAQLGPGVS